MRCFMVGVYLVAATAMVASTCSGDDAAIAREVAEKLRYQQEQENLQGFHITVKVEDGTVWMMGDVADSGQRDLALDIARRVSDVRLVVNDLHFGEDTANELPAKRENSGLGTSLPAPNMPPAPSVPLARSQATAPGEATAPDDNSDLGQQPIMPAAHQTYARPLTSAPTAAAQPVQPQWNAPNRPIGTGVGYQAAMRAHPIHVAQRPSTAINTTAYAPQASGGYCEGCMNGASGVHSHGGTVLSDRAVGGGSYGNGNGGYVDGGYVDGGYGNGGNGNGNGGYGNGGYGNGGYSEAAYGNGGGMHGGISSGQPQMPNYAWPSYASYPNYGAVTYPRQYSPQAWPYIGPFYPYPQVPLGWRKVALEWDDGWWMLDFSHK